MIELPPFPTSGSAVDTADQHTLGWYRARLGNFTGSRIYELLTKGRGGEPFGKTAMTYIYEIAAQRDMNPDIVSNDELFAEWIDYQDVTTRAMRWGTEMESYARDAYAHLNKCKVDENGSVKHPTLPHFASSPDGMVGKEGCVEIKCPNQSTYMLYRSEIKDADTLKAIRPQYYYQCQAHMMCTGAKWCDFITFSPFQKKGHTLHVVRVLPDEDDVKLIEERVTTANEFIDNLIK